MSTTHILYLHGFRSSPASKKAQTMTLEVKSRMPDAVWHCPQLPPSPEQALQEVMTAIAHWPRETMTVIGSSLGGFYATCLAQRLGCKAVLLNPAVRPSRDLANQLGEHAQWHDPEQHFVFETKHVQELQAMEIAKITHPERYFAVIAKGDEVLDWKEMTGHYPGIRRKLLSGGDHALSDFDDHIDEIFEFMQAKSALPTKHMQLEMPNPSGDELKAARQNAGLSQVDAAALMGYPVQKGSRGGLQSRTWQALESPSDPRDMPGPIFAMFQLLTGTHPHYALVQKVTDTSIATDSASVGELGQ